MSIQIWTRIRRNWSLLKLLTLIAAFIPIVFLIWIAVNLAINSILIIDIKKWGLLASTYDSSIQQYGLLPALWGTVLVVLLAILIAGPISLAIALLCNDFSLRFLGAAIRWILGVLSGIPPIIYAMMGSLFFTLFIVPKFTGMGLPGEALPPFGFLPYDFSCTLLGGIMLALLIIPIIAPLMDDAIQNVPSSVREASLSLGANRWQTLQKAVIPAALPGISSAITLGILTAIGDAIIVAYTVGLEYGHLPNPTFDVLEKVAPLTSIVVSLVGGFAGIPSGSLQISLANLIGLFLLIVAFVVLGLTTYLEQVLRKRFAR